MTSAPRQMKPFKLFLGGSGILGTVELTSDKDRYHQLVVGAVTQLRIRLLADPQLRKPILHIFTTVYSDTSPFREDLKRETPIEDQIPNINKIRKIHRNPPSDEDVVEFLTFAFPDLYLEHGDFSEDNLIWGETAYGRGAAKKEEISINIRLINLWHEVVYSNSREVNVSAYEFLVLFYGVFFHELAHSSLVWYGEGCCHSPKTGGIDEDAGDYYEKAVFGGVSSCEISRGGLKITKVGFYIDRVFYAIDRAQAKELLKFSTSKLPLLSNFSLSPSPAVTQSVFRGKLPVSLGGHIKPSTSRNTTLLSTGTRPATHFYPILKGDKKLPSLS